MTGQCTRRDFAKSAIAIATARTDLVVSVNVLFDQASHGGRGVDDRERALFYARQTRAAKEYAVSGIAFQLRFTPGAFVRQQGYSEIPDRFLARDAINLFVTLSLGYDIDRDRTGGSSSGPRPRGPNSPPDPYYTTFLGLHDASDTTLVHEFAHHFTLDTTHRPTGAGNLWADLRNDYWLWRQRHGVPIPEFRACARAPWARPATTTPVTARG